MLVRFLRALLFTLFMLLTMVPWALAIILLTPFSTRIQRYAIARHWTQMMVGPGGCILGIKSQVQGAENLPVQDNTPAILLVKHQSTWETFFMMAYMPKPLAFVFKKELLYLPFFGWAIGLTGMIYINRSKGRAAFQKIIAQGKTVMDEGRWVIFFPEGTRIARGHAGTYKTGGTRLACATGVPVIPVAITSARVWPKHAFLKTPGVVDVAIGKPIASLGRKPDELMQEVQDWIEGQMRQLDASAYTNQTR